MTIYFCLIGYILLLPLLFNLNNSDAVSKQKKIAFWGMFGVFLVLALKSPSIGVDMEGYQKQYNLAKTVSWNDFGFVYFETGYILLEKIFSKLNVSFQLFTAILYCFSSFSWYKLISKYSTDSCLSILFVICYQFFALSVSGLRQVVAMAICVFAFILFDRFDVKGMIFGTILAASAIFVHRSAYIFVVMVIAIILSRKLKKLSIINVGLLLSCAFIFRGVLWTFIDSTLKKVDVGSSVSLGGAFLFQFIIFAFSFFTFFYYYKADCVFGRSLGSMNNIAYEDILALRLSLYSLVVYILLSGGVILRSSMYVMMFVVAFFPRMVAKYNCKSRIIINLALIVVLIYIFYSQTLSINQFEICPYKFFWE